MKQLYHLIQNFYSSSLSIRTVYVWNWQWWLYVNQNLWSLPTFCFLEMPGFIGSSSTTKTSKFEWNIILNNPELMFYILKATAALCNFSNVTKPFGTKTS